MSPKARTDASSDWPAVGAPCADCKVRDDSLCGSLDGAELEDLHRLGRRRRIARGETIIWASEQSLTCANILSGVLKLSALSADGREQIVGLLFASDFFGYPDFTRSEYSITALCDSEICAFPVRDFEAALERHGTLGHALLKRVAGTLEDARRLMLLLGRPSAEERVAGFLLEMSARPGACSARPNAPVTFDLPLSRGAMADMLGLTIETVSRQMTKLRVTGVIALPGSRSVTILSRRRLQKLAQG